MTREDLIETLHGAVVGMVGTRDQKLRPEVLAITGIKAAADLSSITVFVPDGEAAQTFANIADNSAIALTVAEPMSHTTYQFKGTVSAQRPTTTDEQAVQEIYREKAATMLDQIGLGRGLMAVRRLAPSTAIEFSVEDMFDQSPGPNAGNPLELAGA